MVYQNQSFKVVKENYFKKTITQTTTQVRPFGSLASGPPQTKRLVVVDYMWSLSTTFYGIFMYSHTRYFVEIRGNASRRQLKLFVFSY